MAAPTTLNNYQKFMRCMEYRLKQINNDNGFYTDGLVVDRGADPTAFETDAKEEWSQKMRGASLLPGDDEKVSIIGNQSRFRHFYSILCIMELRESEREARLKLDDLRAQLVWDIKRSIRQDVKLQQAAAALNFPISNVNDGQRLSCIDHHVAAVRAGEGIEFPRIMFAVVCQFEDIENIDAVI